MSTPHIGADIGVLSSVLDKMAIAISPSTIPGFPSIKGPERLVDLQHTFYSILRKSSTLRRSIFIMSLYEELPELSLRLVSLCHQNVVMFQR